MSSFFESDAFALFYSAILTSLEQNIFVSDCLLSCFIFQSLFSSALNLSNSLYASCMFEFFSAIRFRSFLFFPLRKRIHCIKSVSLLFFSYQKIQNYCRNFRVQFDKILQTIFSFLCVIGLSARLSEPVRFVADMLIDSFAAFRMITA